MVDIEGFSLCVKYILHITIWWALLFEHCTVNWIITYELNRSFHWHFAFFFATQHWMKLLSCSQSSSGITNKYMLCCNTVIDKGDPSIDGLCLGDTWEVNAACAFAPIALFPVDIFFRRPRRVFSKKDHSQTRRDHTPDSNPFSSLNAEEMFRRVAVTGIPLFAPQISPFARLPSRLRLRQWPLCKVSLSDFCCLCESKSAYSNNKAPSQPAPFSCSPGTHRSIDVSQDKRCSTAGGINGLLFAQMIEKVWRTVQKKMLNEMDVCFQYT